MPPTTIGSIFARQRGASSGFVLLRLALALAVVIGHAPAIVAGDLSEPGPFMALRGYVVLAMFFGLSGFLLAANAERLDLRRFLVHRALRIVPALSVLIALSALVLGPLVTTLPWRDYFSDRQTYEYFAGTIGLIGYRLPGVFKDHPSDTVNSPLWTVSHQFVCYGLMSALVLTGWLRRPVMVVAAALAFDAAGFLAFLVPDGTLPPPVERVAAVVLLGKGARLYAGFLLGIAAYLYRDRLPHSGRLFALCLAVVLSAGAADLFSIRCLPVQPLADALVLPALIYATIYLGLFEPKGWKRASRTDYSYGIYLYGWPIQQSMLVLVPFVRDPLLQCLLAMPVIVGFAMLSWHLVENPVLALHKRSGSTARRRAVDRPVPGLPLSAAAAVG